MGMGAEVSNVLLVTVDSLRVDAVGAYDDTAHTPVLDELATRGTVFERAFATGNWTPFSFPSLLASRPVFADDGRIGVESAPTLAETVSDAGVDTGGFNAANGFLTGHWGYDAGFDEFESFVADPDSLHGQYLARHPTFAAWVQLAATPFRRIRARLGGGSDDRPFLDASRMFDVEQAAETFLSDTREPFFLWVHYMDAHTPYVPAPRYIREVSDGLVGTPQMLHAHTRTAFGREVTDRTLDELETLYRAAVRQVDAGIGRLLDHLEAAGVADDTAVVVAGDHGEEFQEHGHLAHYPKLYDELVHVPLLVATPDGNRRRVGRQVGLDDVPPTVAALQGVDPAAAWTGESLVPVVTGEGQPSTEPVVSVAVRGERVTAQPIPRSLDDGELVAARDRDWTYVRNVDTDAEELYYRPDDPTQQTNLLAAGAEPITGQPDARVVADRLGDDVAEHTRLLGDASDGGAEADVDDGVETRLQALGYR